MSEYVWVKQYHDPDHGSEFVECVFATVEAAMAHDGGYGFGSQPWEDSERNDGAGDFSRIRGDDYEEESITKVKVITVDDLDENGRIKEGVR